jgi:hypothetical protein
MITKEFTVGDLKRLIAESSKNEFKPVLGPNVESDNKSNNDKSYKDAEKRAKDYDGGLSKEEKRELPKKEDFNRTTLDYNPRVEPDKNWKEKVEAQAKGYTSKMEEKNGIEKAAQFDDKGKILNQFKDANKEIEKEKNALATSGLVSSEMDKKGETKEKPTMMESTLPKPKRLLFKHRRFLNESQMLQLIPEEMKKNGQVIHMEDAHSNEYVVECVESKLTGTIETHVTSYKNKEKMNEQMDRIQQLFDYNSRTTSGRNVKPSKLNEDAEFMNLMNMTRK